VGVVIDMCGDERQRGRYRSASVEELPAFLALTLRSGDVGSQ
jgi:hypothetical protein